MKLFILFLLLSFTTSAYAYIDSGTGSLIFQGLVAFFCSGFFAIKMYWQRLKAFVCKNKPPQNIPESTEKHADN